MVAVFLEQTHPAQVLHTLTERTIDEGRTCTGYCCSFTLKAFDWQIEFALKLCTALQSPTSSFLLKDSTWLFSSQMMSGAFPTSSVTLLSR